MDDGVGHRVLLLPVELAAPLGCGLFFWRHARRRRRIPVDAPSALSRMPPRIGEPVRQGEHRKRRLSTGVPSGAPVALWTSCSLFAAAGPPDARPSPFPPCAGPAPSRRLIS